MFHHTVQMTGEHYTMSHYTVQKTDEHYTMSHYTDQLTGEHYTMSHYTVQQTYEHYTNQGVQLTTMFNFIEQPSLRQSDVKKLETMSLCDCIFRFGMCDSTNCIYLYN